MSDWHDTKGSSQFGSYRADWSGRQWIAKRTQKHNFPITLGKFETREEAKACCEERMRGCPHLLDISTSPVE